MELDPLAEVRRPVLEDRRDSEFNHDGTLRAAELVPVFTNAYLTVGTAVPVALVADVLSDKIALAVVLR